MNTSNSKAVRTCGVSKQNVKKVNTLDGRRMEETESIKVFRGKYFDLWENECGGKP